MLRRHHRFFQSLLILLDGLTAGLAFALAYLLRFYTDFIPSAGEAIAKDTALIVSSVMILWPLVGWISGLYVSQRMRSLISEAFRGSKVTVITLVSLVTITYFTGTEGRYSRATLLLWAVLAITLFILSRLVMRATLRSLRRRGFNLRHVLIVGLENQAQHVQHIIDREGYLGIRTRGFVAEDRDAGKVGGHVQGIPILGTVSQFGLILKRWPVDQVIVALPMERLGALKKIMRVLSNETVDVRLVPDLHQYATLCGSIEEFSGLPIINLQASPLIGWGLLAKRCFDISVSLFGLLLFGPLMALVALGIKLSSPGPVIFRQRRMGMDGRLFTMHKFRTMSCDSEVSGAQMTAHRDPRVTPLGSLLRRTSIDELPQLWDVLVGEMSLVGPRPEQPAFIDEFKTQIPRYALRHKMKAGMTGWAQVNGLRGNTSIQDRIEMDLYYIENWSLTFDLRILIRTALGGFLSPNAY